MAYGTNDMGAPPTDPLWPNRRTENGHLRIHMVHRWTNREGRMEKWDDYRLLLALDRAGSVRKAADALGVGHATVSRRLGALQDALGLRLLARQGRKLCVHRGRARGDRGRSADGAAGVGGRAASGSGKGRRRRRREDHLAGWPGRCARELALRTHGSATPNLCVALRTGWSFESLLRREADVAIRAAAEPDDALVGRRLGALEVAAFAHRDLRGQAVPWVGWEGRPTADMQRWMRTAVPGARIVALADNETTAAALVRQRVGAAYLPAPLGDADPALARVDAPTLEAPLWLLVHPDLRRSPRIRAVLDWLTQALYPPLHRPEALARIPHQTTPQSMIPVSGPGIPLPGAGMGIESFGALRGGRGRPMFAGSA